MQREELLKSEKYYEADHSVDEDEDDAGRGSGDSGGLGMGGMHIPSWGSAH